uniref:Uncharacterized protein n=1 Tax=Amphiprion percula TaxID=161767 RepID=A0A3P8U1A5_AMPPE
MFSGVFDPNIPEEGPSAPPPGWLDDIHGYQGHKGGGQASSSSALRFCFNIVLSLSGLVPTVSEDVARDALIKFVESKWRYSSKPARNLTFKELKAITVYRSSLFVLFPGQLVDGPQYGVSPPPWDVQVMFPQRYADQVEKVRVPHSSFVKVMAGECTSAAVLTCPSSSRCFSCHGRGFKTCSVCHGSQNLLHFILLTVTWKNNVENFIPDRQPEFPDKNFGKVSGDPFFVDENVLVYPIQGFPDQEICDVSSKMINDHLVRFTSTSRILQQRQTIELVPLTHAYYSYNGKDYSFFVYGIENKVFMAKYPSACTLL